jgi:hypothetical protein
MLRSEDAAKLLAGTAVSPARVTAATTHFENLQHISTIRNILAARNKIGIRESDTVLPVLCPTLYA